MVSNKEYIHIRYRDTNSHLAFSGDPLSLSLSGSLVSKCWPVKKIEVRLLGAEVLLRF